MLTRSSNETTVTFSDASFTAVVRSEIIAGSPVTWTFVPAGVRNSSTRSRSQWTSWSDSGEPTADARPTTM